MCGLVGYVGHKPATQILLSLLERLEYRGYDSAGIAINTKGILELEKSAGLLTNLKNKLNPNFNSNCGIGHTRWATHGEPSEKNAHPHLSQNGKIAIIHNGIIENFGKLKSELTDVKFCSDTDTEVIVQMLSKQITNKSDANHILASISKVCSKLKGSYAFAILVAHMPNKIFFAKKKSPLIIGCGEGENFLASDIPAVLPYTNKVIYLSDNEIGYISENEVKIYDFKLNKKHKIVKKVDLSPNQIMLGNYSSFMEKEIAQGSYAIVNTLSKLVKDKVFCKIKKCKISDFLGIHSNIHIVACGTALHAGMIAKFLLERECRVFVSLDYASEFRYKKPILNKKSLCIFISQSGETADTLASLELAKKQGAYCVAITNVLASRISQIADFVIPTYAGPEIAVASTKAYVAQLTALYYFVELFAKANSAKIKYQKEDILKLAHKLEDWSCKEDLKKIVPQLAKQESLFFIGRGIDYYLALEGALKLKEISYIHCEAFAGGELKHGSLALVTADSFVVVILTQKDLMDKTMNAVHEIKSRGAFVVLFSQFTALKNQVDFFVELKVAKDILMPFVAIKPLQELAFLCSSFKGLNPDKPRNLAKSVTVE